MKVYIAGIIAGADPVEAKKAFIKAELGLRNKGLEGFSPKGLLDYPFLSEEDLAHIRHAMIDECDAVWLPKDWKGSKEMTDDYYYAKEWRKEVLWEDETAKEGRE